MELLDAITASYIIVKGILLCYRTQQYYLLDERLPLFEERGRDN